MTTPTTVQVQIQLRADTAANWTSEDPVLLAAEVGLETDTKKLKVGDGTTAWNSLAYFPSIVSGGTVLGNLEIGSTGTLTFEGSTADGFETTLAVTDPTADRTITLPDQSGTVVVTGNASIVDADIAANAEIAVSKLADGAARQLLQTDAAGTGVEWTDNVDVPGTLDVTGAATFDGAVTVQGDLTVNGTTTTVNTETLTVKDKNIELAVVNTPTDTTADGGGITLKGATDKTINWVDATDAWTSSERFSYPLGSAAAPALTFTGDPNTGIYSPGADQVAISTNGTGRLFVDSSGKVGIGTAIPATNLHIRATGTPILRIQDDDGTGQYSDFYNSAGQSIYNAVNGAGVKGAHIFLQAGTEAARIDTSGRLGLGTTSPLMRLDVVEDNPGRCINLRSSDLTEGGRIGTSGELTTSNGIIINASRALGSIQLQTNSIERARLDSSGRLLVGTSSNSGGALLQVNGDRIRVGTAKTPASASDTGTAGEICWDADYIYVCTATNTWKRAALSTW